jgi:hypothetical protein
MILGEELLGPRVQTIFALRFIIRYFPRAIFSKADVFRLLCDREGRNDVIEEIDSLAKRIERDAFIIGVHTQTVRFLERERIHAIRLHAPQTKARRIGGAGGHLRHKRGAGELAARYQSDGVVKIGCDGRGWSRLAGACLFFKPALRVIE